jgi:glutamine---fructose-6-phosphate transaminase (isomerizing)
MNDVAGNDVPGGLMAAEIAEQPAVLLRLLNDGAQAIAEVAQRVVAFGPRTVMFAARGTSDHAALYGSYLAQIRLGVASGLSSPSTTTVYGARPDLQGVLFVAVSQSGGSPDLVDSVAVARECGALTVAVTNAPDSSLAAAAELNVDVCAGAERAVAATKSYTAELLALYLLLVGAAGRLDGESLAALSDAANATTSTFDAADSAARTYRFAERIVVTARGYSYPTAREAALKMMETSYLSAHPFSGADLLHGPLAMVDASVPVIAIVTPGVGGAAMAPVVERLRSIGSDPLLVGPAGGLPVATDGVVEELWPVLEILPLQRLAWRMALDRGLDPDHPRGLLKVTETH